jgi:hypothetical protein
MTTIVTDPIPQNEIPDASTIESDAKVIGSQTISGTPTSVEFPLNLIETKIKEGLATDTDLADAIADHEAASNPHPAYLTQTEGDTRYYQSGEEIAETDIPTEIARITDINNAIDNHESATNPHPFYIDQIEAAISTHEATTNPHPAYLTEAEGNALYASLAAGVPPGGTTRQVIAKASNADYDTEWVDAPSEGGSGGPEVTWSSSADSSITLAENTGTVCTGAALQVLELPTGAAQFDKIKIRNTGTGGFRAQVTGGNIALVDATDNALESIETYASADLILVQASPLLWIVENPNATVQLTASSNVDPDAAAIVAAIETALGSALNSTQTSAIEARIFAAKNTVNNWSGIYGMYQMIGGVLSPSDAAIATAIDGINWKTPGTNDITWSGGDGTRNANGWKPAADNNHGDTGFGLVDKGNGSFYLALGVSEAASLEAFGSVMGARETAGSGPGLTALFSSSSLIQWQTRSTSGGSFGIPAATGYHATSNQSGSGQHYYQGDPRSFGTYTVTETFTVNTSLKVGFATNYDAGGGGANPLTYTSFIFSTMGLSGTAAANDYTAEAALQSAFGRTI